MFCLVIAKGGAMKSFKTNRMIFAIGALVIGIILLVWPGKSLMILAKCVGVLLAVGGLASAFMFIKDHETASRSLLLVMAVIMLVCGIVIFLHPDELVKLIPTIMGVLVVISGIINLGETFLLNRRKYGRWWITLLVSLATIAGGIFLISNAFKLASLITRIAGGILIFDGVSDLWVLSRIHVSEKNETVDVEAVEVPVTPGEAAKPEETPGETVNPVETPVEAAKPEETVEPEANEEPSEIPPRTEDTPDGNVPPINSEEGPKKDVPEYMNQEEQKEEYTQPEK